MFTVVITEKGGAQKRMEFDKPEVTIGRVQGNDIILPKGNVSKRHSRIVLKDGRFIIVDLKSTNGTYVNGRKITAPLVIKGGDKVYIGDFILSLEDGPTADISAGGAQSVTGQPAMEPGGGGPRRIAPPPPLPQRAAAAPIGLGDATSQEEPLSEESGAHTPPPMSPPPPQPTPAPPVPRPAPRPIPAPAVPASRPRPPSAAQMPAATPLPPVRQAAPVQQPAPVRAAAAAPARAPAAPARRGDAARAKYQALLKEIHERLLEFMDLRRLDLEKLADEELWDRTERSIGEIVDQMAQQIPPTIDRDSLIKDVLNEALGLGPLEDLLQDNTVTEIMVNHAEQIYVERDGRLEQSDKTFSSNKAVLGVIERIVAPIGRRIDESSPLVDARLKDGSRVNAIIPPLALKGPSVTIRKFRREVFGAEDLVRLGTLSRGMAEFIEICVTARKNIVIAGGTGSGKTTTLNCISSFIPGHERIVTIEDAAELQLPQEHVVSLETRPPNVEGKGQVSIRDLVRNSLRMRPDRIVVGECRGGEALDMLQAMNTGHDGSLTTLHANSPRDALSRLETMVLMAGMDLPMRAIREQIASAVDILVQQTRFGDGSRRITHIVEITGMEGDVISTQEIFTFKQDGVDAQGRVVGRFMASGFTPRFYEDLQARGLPVNMNIFRE